MDAPARVAGDELRAERLKVLRSIRPIEPGDAVLGQYEGYGDEEGIEDGSGTDTFAAMRVEVDSWRWADVPCYLRTGKRLREGRRDRRRVPPLAAPAVRGRRRLGRRQPPDHRHPARREGAAARHRQAARRGPRARRGRARLRRRRGRGDATRRRPTSACSATRSPATRRSSPPATRSRRSGPRSRRCSTARIPSPTRRARPARRRPTRCRAATRSWRTLEDVAG